MIPWVLSERCQAPLLHFEHGTHVQQDDMQAQGTHWRVQMPCDGKCAAFMSMATSCQFPGIHAVGQGYKYRMETMLSLCLAEKWHVLGLEPKNILKHKR